MKIALIGYGKMGKAIEAIAAARGHEISLRITSQNADFDPSELQGTNVAIEFSTPENATANIKKCFEAGIPVVVGTTGWYDDYPALCNQAEKDQCTLLTATNFSVGVNLFFALNQHLAKLMQAYPEYEVDMEEIHHTQKLDAPSGTAITLAESIIEHHSSKKAWVNEKSDDPHRLEIHSKRIDKVPGTHTIRYASEIDTIEIKHTAHNRKGFATGAVLAAEYIHDKQGVFTMNDVLGL